MTDKAQRSYWLGSASDIKHRVGFLPKIMACFTLAAKEGSRKCCVFAHKKSGRTVIKLQFVHANNNVKTAISPGHA
ncbi:hypothetical protein MJ581_10330 [Escherichia coli]|nr:hypothetical protein MJ581_10330 [Escherichia coli]